MRKNTKKILAVLLATLMLMSMLAACGSEKEDDVTDETTSNVIETPEPDTDNGENEIQYKEKFCFSDEDGITFLGLTDTEAYLKKSTYDGYGAAVREINGTYSIDKNGNYVIDYFVEHYLDEYFGYSMPSDEYRDADGQLVLQKCVNNMYCLDDDIVVMKLGQTSEKFLWGGYNYSGTDMDIEQNTTEIEGMELYYLDGATGEAKAVTVTPDNITLPDTSVVGENTFKVNYDGKEHTLSCYVYGEGNRDSLRELVPQGIEYESLCMRSEAELPEMITESTIAEQYFANYQGTESLFYISGDEEDIPVNNYEIKLWDTSKVNYVNEMIYVVSVTVDGTVYRYVDDVCVVPNGKDDKGVLTYVIENPEVIESDAYLLFVPKGCSLAENMAAGYRPFVDGDSHAVEVTVSGYDPNKIGAQCITVSYDGAVNTLVQPIYVYDSTAPLLTEIDIEGLKITNYAVDYSNAKVLLTYCDGSTKEESVDDYKQYFVVHYSYTIEGDDPNGPLVVKDATIECSYPVTVDGKQYFVYGRGSTN